MSRFRLCLLVTLAHAALFVIPTIQKKGDISWAVCLGADRASAPEFAGVKTVWPAPGYDGVFVYLCAKAPAEPSGLIDRPAYRRVRLLTPLLAWGLSMGGRDELLPWALPLVNLFAVFGLSWVGSGLARHYGRPVWWGVLLPVAVNAGGPLMRDLTDPWGALGAIGLIAAVIRQKPPPVILFWGAAALFAREQNAAIALVAFLSLVREPRRAAAGALAWAGLFFVAWVGILYHLHGALPVAAENLDAPLKGLLFRAENWGGNPGEPPTKAHLVGLPWLAVMIFSALAAVVFRAGPWARILGVFGLTLAVFGGVAVYLGEASYARVLLWLPMSAWFAALATGRRWWLWAALTSAVWPLLALYQTVRALS